MFNEIERFDRRDRVERARALRLWEDRRMKSLIDWLKRIFYSLTPTAWPEVKSRELLHADRNADLKVCALAVAECGILFTPYHNITRHNAWIKRIGRDGLVTTPVTSDRVETFGTPDRVGDAWMFPVEEPDGRVRLISDKHGTPADGPRQPAQYATRCVGGVIGCNGGGNKPFLWDAAKNKRLHTFDVADGIISGIARVGSDWVIAIMDGDKPGLFSTRGWRVAGKYVEVANLNGELIAFEKSGAVEVFGADGKRRRVIGSTGNKAQRARVRGGLLYWSTANWDQLWVTDGRKMKLLTEWKEGDKGDSTTSGSLFNTSLDFDGNDIVVARSVDRRGYEIWRVKLK